MLLDESLMSKYFGSDYNNVEIYNEGVDINWDVFTNFMGNPDGTEDLIRELQMADAQFRHMSDTQLYRERVGALEAIVAIHRFLWDLEAVGDIFLAPFTLGLSLITYLLTRLIRLPVDAIYHNKVVRQADECIETLYRIKRRNPKQAREIDNAISRIRMAM